MDVPNASAAKLDSFWLCAEAERERDGPREAVVVVGCRKGGGCGRGFDELVEALLREDVGFVMMGGFGFGFFSRFGGLSSVVDAGRFVANRMGETSRVTVTFFRGENFETVNLSWRGGMDEVGATFSKPANVLPYINRRPAAPPTSKLWSVTLTLSSTGFNREIAGASLVDVDARPSLNFIDVRVATSAWRFSNLRGVNGSSVVRNICVFAGVDATADS